MLVRPEVVDPEPLGPWCLTRALPVKKEDVSFDALSVEYASGEPQECLDITLVNKSISCD